MRKNEKVRNGTFPLDANIGALRRSQPLRIVFESEMLKGMPL